MSATSYDSPPSPNASKPLVVGGALGEHVAMVLLWIAGFGATCWMLYAPQVPMTWQIATFAVWIVARLTRFQRPSTLSFMVSLTLFAWSCWAMSQPAPAVPEWLHSGVFSARCFSAMLMILLVADAARFFRCHRGRMAGLVPVLIVSVLILTLVLIPGIQFLVEAARPPVKKPAVLEDMSVAENVLLRCVEFLTGFWFFVMGSVIGSYLNVLVYRMPRSESTLLKPSSCPKCRQPILGKDNIPLLGWLRLGGRCRSCREPISARYPIVEAISGTIFLLFFFIELMSGGNNLPVRPPNFYAGVVWIIFYTKWDLIGLYVYHLMLMMALLTWGLISHDRHVVPVRSIVTALLMSVLIPLIWPHIILVPAASWLSAAGGVLRATVTMCLGGAAGFLIGYFVSMATLYKDDSWLIRRNVRASFILIGTMLGWQAACMVGALTLLMDFLSRKLISTNRNRGYDVVLVMVAAVLIHHAVWRQLVELRFMK